MTKIKLDAEEKELLDAFENDELESVLTEQSRAELQASAKSAIKKDKRINIRLSSNDLYALQKKALEEGIPYQTLVSSILHKYVSGRYHD